MNSLPRWLISITDMPLPRQSSISSRACTRTSSGSTAGPALKLYTRDISLSRISRKSFVRRVALAQLLRGLVGGRFVAAVAERGDAVDADQLLALAQADELHALGVPAEDRDVRDRRAHQGAAVGDEHD